MKQYITLCLHEDPPKIAASQLSSDLEKVLANLDSQNAVCAGPHVVYEVFLTKVEVPCIENQ